MDTACADAAKSTPLAARVAMKYSSRCGSPLPLRLLAGVLADGSGSDTLVVGGCASGLPKALCGDDAFLTPLPAIAV